MAAAPAPPRGAPTSKSGVKVASIPPNQTLYVTNLPSSKIQKADLKTALYMLFSTYGPILDVVAMKTMKMRGQAHIVFRDLQAATQALRSLDGAQFLGKEMKIQYAKSKSDTIAKLDGTFKIPGAATNVEVTELQQSIFNAPLPGATSTTGQPAKPPSTTHNAARDTNSPESRGQKRSREEEEDESDEDVAMEEDSDDE